MPPKRKTSDTGDNKRKRKVIHSLWQHRVTAFSFPSLSLLFPFLSFFYFLHSPFPSLPFPSLSLPFLSLLPLLSFPSVSLPFLFLLSFPSVSLPFVFLLSFPSVSLPFLFLSFPYLISFPSLSLPFSSFSFLYPFLIAGSQNPADREGKGNGGRGSEWGGVFVCGWQVEKRSG